MKHEIYKLLFKLGISNYESLEKYSNSVRDKKNISVFKCKKSGVIILDDIASGCEETYKEKKGLEYFGVSHINVDDEKRAGVYKDIIRGKNWLDFGCGMGGPSILLKDFAQNAHGLELQEAPRDYVNSKGVKCFSSLDQLEDNFYDVITMFHVYEHLSDPIGLLKICHKKLKSGGTLIVEVPHAKDALLSVYESESFKKFTLWSEHLILHTKYSLELFLAEASFKINSIKSYQRYPLSNHLHWLAKNQPGGHLIWTFLNSQELEKAYENILSQNDCTDTIVAYCTKP